VPELLSSYGPDFDAHYLRYETEGKGMKKVPARVLYSRMMQTLAETGNGWMCFKDKANLRCSQTAQPGNVVHSSNLCTEILEVTSGEQTAVCNLGSINLGAYVDGNGKFDFERLRYVVDKAVSFLDRVVDINYYPIGEARNSNHYWRPIGLGVMGLQDTFFKMRLPFESPEAQRLSARIAEEIYYHAIKASMRLAQEKGSFDGFKNSRYAEGQLQVQPTRELQPMTPELHYDWDDLAWQVKQNGLRNSLLIAIAPTATIASISGCFESIEPQISNMFKRETLSGEFLQVNKYLIGDLKRLGLWTAATRTRILEAEGSIQELDGIPEEIKGLHKTVWEIPQKALIDMAAERSAFICQSQSLNLFQENPTLGKLSSMYMYAWKQGIKTTYYLRSRAKTAIQKTTTVAEPEAAAAIACSLENPESCEACQ
jgi:ribonucleoside-diphosphate reductase alpha chain